MYQLISAIAKALDGNQRWANVDIGDVSLSTLYSQYSKVFLTLSNPFYPAPIAIDLADIRSGVGGGAITINELLVQVGNTTLPVLDRVPVIDPKYARYAGGFQAGYKVTPIHSRSAVDAQLPLSEKPWLHLTRPNTDYNLFYRSCLVNINGFFHLTDNDVNGVYVQDGMKSAVISGENQIGIYSFREIGSLSFIPITETMLYKQIATQRYRDKCFIDTGVDLSNKTVMLVLGGYLHVLDKKTFYRISESAFAVDFANLPLLDRYYESRKYLDFSSLPLGKTDRNESQISVEEFFSDENLTAYLTLSQSFFVILDNPEIFINHLPVRSSPITDLFISDLEPIYPLITGKGKVANYIIAVEDKQFGLSCLDTQVHNYIYDSVDQNDLVAVSDSEDITRPKLPAVAYMLEIGSDIQ